jgi:hypothetical protein
MKKKYIYACVILFSVLLITPLLFKVFAQVATSNCVITNVGNPAKNQPLPAGCNNGVYANPFPGGWQPSRLDMGYDGTFKGQIHAPFAGKIVYAGTGVATWGGYLELQASQQLPGLPSKTLYFAEGISPLVKTGDSVTVNEPIAQAVPNSVYNGIVGNIEFGVSDDGPGYVDTYCLGTLKCGPCPDTANGSNAMVLNFAKWVEANLHVAPPATTDDAGCA